MIRNGREHGGPASGLLAASRWRAKAAPAASAASFGVALVAALAMAAAVPLPLAAQRAATAAAPVPASAAAPAAAPHLDARDFAMADIMTGHEFALDSVGSITAGIVAGDSLVWTHSYGWADMDTHTPATRHTVYRVGSITKTFTAVMLWQLVQRGTLSLDAPVARWVPEIRRVRGLPPGAQSPTIMQLATMTAGLAREPKREGHFWSGPVSRWDSTLVAALPHTIYDFTPGTRYQYSNIGYAILGLALERAAHTPYVTWEREHVLRPLGMRHSAFRVDAAIRPQLALGYGIRRAGAIDDTTAQREARTGRGYKVPNGALFTTVDDLARFVELELGHGPDSVLHRATLQRQFGGFVASSANLKLGYGPGFMATRTSDGGLVLGHTGSVAGFTAAMEYSRAADLGVIVLRNAWGGHGNPGRLARNLLRRLVAAQTRAPGRR